MLFGRGNRKIEVREEELEGYLDSLFDGKLNGLESRASNIVKELLRARLQFANSSKSFGELKAEPELEYFFIDNINFIKGQKLSYTKTLNRLIEEWDVGQENKAGTANRYFKYSDILSNADAFIQSVLKTNNNFKKVLQSYPGHLDQFKNSFSMIERHAESLRGELSRNESPLSEYKTVKAGISEFKRAKERSALIEESIRNLNERAKLEKDGTGVVLDIQKAISEKELELSELNAEISSLQGRINIAATAIERPARKFDHVSGRKIQLHKFLEDPFNSIKSEQDYSEFISMLKLLKGFVGDGKVEVKNPQRLLECIDELLEMNIHEKSKKMTDLQVSRSSIMRNIAKLREEHERNNEKRNASESAIRSIESLRAEAADCLARENSAKAALESLFLKYYGKNISIIR
jgi:DNA repair exonuclease SbcCD ATPase subunit